MVGIHFIHFTFTEWRSENCDRWLRWTRRWCMSRWHTGYRDLISRGSAPVIGCSNIHRLIMTKKNNRITKAISKMGKVSVQCWKIQSPTSKLCCSPQTTLYTPHLHLRSRRLGLNPNLDASLPNWQISLRMTTIRWIPFKTSPSTMSIMQKW